MQGSGRHGPKRQSDVFLVLSSDWKGVIVGRWDIFGLLNALLPPLKFVCVMNFSFPSLWRLKGVQAWILELAVARLHVFYMWDVDPWWSAISLCTSQINAQRIQVYIYIQYYRRNIYTICLVDSPDYSLGPSKRRASFQSGQFLTSMIMGERVVYIYVVQKTCVLYIIHNMCMMYGKCTHYLTNQVQSSSHTFVCISYAACTVQ